MFILFLEYADLLAFWYFLKGLFSSFHSPSEPPPPPVSFIKCEKSPVGHGISLTFYIRDGKPATQTPHDSSIDKQQKRTDKANYINTNLNKTFHFQPCVWLYSHYCVAVLVSGLTWPLLEKHVKDVLTLSIMSKPFHSQSTVNVVSPFLNCAWALEWYHPI